MMDGITAIFMIAGGIFSFTAAVGMLRLPDTIMRMHAATKAGALGAGLMFLAVACHYLEFSTTLRALAAIVFLLLTAPVAAHLIGRAAYCTRVRLWEKTWIDELAYTCDWCEIDPQTDPDGTNQ
ncbi:MAG: monovalent cation/H(+) antiporter subunit G [Thermodesulfobacteriota bacterium]